MEDEREERGGRWGGWVWEVEVGEGEGAVGRYYFGDFGGGGGGVLVRVGVGVGDGFGFGFGGGRVTVGRFCFLGCWGCGFICFTCGIGLVVAMYAFLRLALWLGRVAILIHSGGRFGIALSRWLRFLIRRPVVASSGLDHVGKTVRSN